MQNSRTIKAIQLLAAFLTFFTLSTYAKPHVKYYENKNAADTIISISGPSSKGMFASIFIRDNKGRRIYIRSTILDTIRGRILVPFGTGIMLRWTEDSTRISAIHRPVPNYTLPYVEELTTPHQANPTQITDPEELEHTITLRNHGINRMMLALTDDTDDEVQNTSTELLKIIKKLGLIPISAINHTPLVIEIEDAENRYLRAFDLLSEATPYPPVPTHNSRYACSEVAVPPRSDDSNIITWENLSGNNSYIIEINELQYNTPPPFIAATIYFITHDENREEIGTLIFAPGDLIPRFPNLLIDFHIINYNIQTPITLYRVTSFVTRSIPDDITSGFLNMYLRMRERRIHWKIYRNMFTFLEITQPILYRDLINRFSTLTAATSSSSIASTSTANPPINDTTTDIHPTFLESLRHLILDTRLEIELPWFGGTYK